MFGYEPGSAEEELRRRVRAMVEPLARPRGMALLAALPLLVGREAAVNDRVRVRAPGGRRARSTPRSPAGASLGDDALAAADDVFSALLLAEDEEGRRLSDREVRDELMTLLLAGHETTATGLAWCFDLVLHAPAVHAPARSAATSGIWTRWSRSRCGSGPVIPGVGRVVRGAAVPARRVRVPEGIEINPSIRMIHRREDLYPDAGAFRPERFLVDDPPDTYTWIPFGGGTRRCLGASRSR